MALDVFNPYLFVSAGEQSNKYLTPSYAGGIASFQAQRAQALSKLLVQIDPVQEGTGDPSPTNIRPITGRTGMTVTRAGKNILDPSYMVRGSVFVDNGNGTYTFSKTGTGASGRITWSAPVVADNGTTVTFSADITGTHESEIYFGFALDETTSGATVECTIANGRITGTITSTAYMNGLRLYWRNNSTGVGTDSVVLSNMQVEYGSTVTAYEPYTKQTYPITWESTAGTVYGGSLDVVSGVLTVDRMIADLGDFTYTYDATIPRFHTTTLQNRIVKPANGNIVTTAITSMYKAVSFNELYQTSKENGTFAVSNNGIISFINTAYSDAAEFKTAMAGQKIAYPLATPQTYQLDPEDIMTLPGYNQIYTDAGPVIDIKF